MTEPLNTRETLLQKIKNSQDDQSWEEFTDYYQGYIYAVVLSMNINYHDTQDLVQSVLLKAWKNLPDFEYDPGKGRFRGWLTTVTKNTVKRFLHKKSRQLENSDDSKKEELEQYISGVSLPDIESIAQKEWEVYLSKMAWENIKDDLAENVRDTFLDFMSGTAVRDIAKKFGFPENTIHVYKNRVQKRLFKEILRLEAELS
ncbi:MAG: RNA polymerase sigma factor [Lentisphaeraceae bacterium]|nr:RNA polymerase sigma factor [Lentisphaeraceae bacterium]